MGKKFLKEVKPNCNLYIDEKTGIAWIENRTSGTSHSVHPNISVTGSIGRMKELGYWEKNDVVVRSHGWQYNISKFVCSDELDDIVGEYCQCKECIKRRAIESMTNKNKDSLKYELGVLMFNAYINSDITEDELTTNEAFENASMNYDICGNFLSIFNSVEVEIDELKDGFIQEGLNRNYSENELKDMFLKAKNKIGKAVL